MTEYKHPMKIKYYECDKCGSDDLVWDAYACWDIENQCMELANSYDGCGCKTCGIDNVHPVEKEKEVAY